MTVRQARERVDKKRPPRSFSAQPGSSSGRRKPAVAVSQDPKPDTAASIDPVDANPSDGLRVDKTDGGAYGLDDFISVYGGTRTNPPPEWALAETAGDAPHLHWHR